MKTKLFILLTVIALALTACAPAAAPATRRSAAGRAHCRAPTHRSAESNRSSSAH